MKIKECPRRIKGRCDILSQYCAFNPGQDRKDCPVNYPSIKKDAPRKRKSK